MLKLGIALAAAGDVANFYLALSLVFNEQIELTVVLVLGVTAGSLGLAHSAGVLLHRLQVRPPRAAATAVLVATATAWLLLGVGVLFVRSLAPAQSASAGDQFGGTASADVPTGAAPWLMALFLLTVYVASGVLTAWHSFDEQLVGEQRSAWQQLRKANTERRQIRDVVAHHAALLQLYNKHGNRLNDEYRNAKQKRLEIAREFREQVRLRIAADQGEPLETNLLTTRSEGTRP